MNPLKVSSLGNLKERAFEHFRMDRTAHRKAGSVFLAKVSLHAVASDTYISSTWGSSGLSSHLCAELASVHSFPFLGCRIRVLPHGTRYEKMCHS